MKTAVKIIVIMTLCNAFGDETANKTDLFHHVKILLAQVENRVPERDRNVYYFSEHLNYKWKETPEFSQLKEAVAGSWKAILKYADDISVLSDVHQIILFESFCCLPQENAFQSLDMIADLALDNVIAPNVFYTTIMGYNINNRKVLALNHDNPVVSGMLRKSKVIYPKRSDYFNEMLSGARKREYTSPLYYDMETNTYPNLYSAKSWIIFIIWVFSFFWVIVISVTVIVARKRMKLKRSRKTQIGKQA